MIRYSFLIFSTSLLLAGCSIFGGGGDNIEIEFDDDVGPETKALVNSLPSGLIGDKENALHTHDNLRAKDDDDADPPQR